MAGQLKVTPPSFASFHRLWPQIPFLVSLQSNGFPMPVIRLVIHPVNRYSIYLAPAMARQPWLAFAVVLHCMRIDTTTCKANTQRTTSSDAETFLDESAKAEVITIQTFVAVPAALVSEDSHLFWPLC